MPYVFDTPFAMKDKIGLALGPTDWVVVDQDRIDKFAEATGDFQWIHVDRERSKTGPYGTTIAHGFLTLSLVNLFMPQLIKVNGIAMGLNYGLDKVRFPSVVPAGSRIRGKGELVSVEEVKGPAIQSMVRVTVEIEGSDKPACVAEKLSRWYPE